MFGPRCRWGLSTEVQMGLRRLSTDTSLDEAGLLIPGANVLMTVLHLSPASLSSGS